jgi:hypothetical protein
MSRYLIAYGDGTDVFQLDLVDAREEGFDFKKPEAFFKNVEEDRIRLRYQNSDHPPRLPHEDCGCTIYREAASGDFELLGQVCW